MLKSFLDASDRTVIEELALRGAQTATHAHKIPNLLLAPPMTGNREEQYPKGREKAKAPWIPQNA
jgi:hypothetical protein